MRGSVTIQFLNHASVKLITPTVAIVADPWLSGAIFNNGWELLRESPELVPVAADSDFVWISHEHPDHFSPGFFRSIEGMKPRVLFQETRDHRVTHYLGARGFDTIEVGHCERIKVSPTEYFTIGRNGLYDSWSLFESGGLKILNINDCILKSRRLLRAMKRRIGHVDVLLTQFSYAGWVGNRDNKRLHEEAAKRRLDVVRRQIECLEPDFVIPFASFSWYCHEENAYLNASINRIRDFLDVSAGSRSVPIVMKPHETWAVGEVHDNSEAIEFWESTYDAIPSRPLRVCRSRVAMASLWRDCDAYQRRVFAKNSKTWMKLLACVPFLGLFRPVCIRLTDTRNTVRFSFFDELQEVSDTTEPDIEMSCESLSFMFANEFGFDTLMVNARFNATKRGLDRVMRNFAVGTVNTIGWAVGWSLFPMFVREFKLIWLVAHELSNVNPE